MNGHLCSLIDMVETAQDERMVKIALSNFTHACGFERFAYLQTAGSDIRTFNNYPTEWQESYFRNLYSRVDPVVTEARRRMAMFSWTAENWPAKGSSELRNFRDEAVGYGLRSGLTIPIEGSFGSKWMLTFASSNIKAEEIHLPNPQKAVQAMLTIHYRLRTITGCVARLPECRLSPRESICLMWAAKGKVGHEIADLTGVNPRTVQHYLDNARRKLGAVTIPQLVAIAKDLGLM